MWSKKRYVSRFCISQRKNVGKRDAVKFLVGFLVFWDKIIDNLLFVIDWFYACFDLLLGLFIFTDSIIVHIFYVDLNWKIVENWFFLSAVVLIEQLNWNCNDGSFV